MLVLLLKSKNPEISGLMSIAICLVIISLCVDKLKIFVESVENITTLIKLDKTYVAVLLKLIGIAYICEFGAGISKDAGYSAVASHIELLGKLTMLTVSLPVFISVVQMILDMM